MLPSGAWGGGGRERTRHPWVENADHDECVGGGTCGGDHLRRGRDPQIAERLYRWGFHICSMREHL